VGRAEETGIETEAAKDEDDCIAAEASAEVEYGTTDEVDIEEKADGDDSDDTVCVSI
jgi:hypothetical protein